MNNPDYRKIALKIGRLGFFTDIHNCGCPTDSWPINLYCEMKCLRFYVAYIKGSQWVIDYSRDPKVIRRADMAEIRGIKNQTQMLKFVKGLVNKHSMKILKDGSVEVSA